MTQSIAQHTNSLTLEDITRRYEKVSYFLDWQGRADRLIAIVDLSSNNQLDFCIRDPLLVRIAEALVRLSRQYSLTVALLFPEELPGQSAQFWQTLEEILPTGRAIVLGRTTVEFVGRPIQQRDVKAYHRKAAGLGQTTQQRFGQRLVRRLGHFAISTTQCADSFFDASLAERELEELVQAKFDSYGLVPSDTVVVVPSNTADWMMKAVLVEVSKRSMSGRWNIDVLEGATTVPESFVGKRALICTDVVRSGSSLSRLISNLRDLDVEIHPKILAGVAPTVVPVFSASTVLDPIQRSQMTWVSQKDCPQCELSLGFTPKDENLDQVLGLRSWDYWRMALSVPWGEETYGPKTRQMTRFLPNYLKMFEAYGDHIALVLKKVFKEFGLTQEVVIACPDEPAMLELQRHLNVRLSGRVILMPLTREDLSENFDRQADRGVLWISQARQLATNGRPVVIVDELARSGQTARQIWRALSSQGVSVAAFVPIVNLAPGLQFDIGIRTHALYEHPLVEA